MNSLTTSNDFQAIFELFPFPCYLVNLEDNSIILKSEGSLFNTPKYTKENISFIQESIREEGWRKCLDGYSIYVEKFHLSRDYLLIVHGLKVKGVWKSKGKDLNLSIICTRKDISDLVNQFVSSITNIISRHNDIIHHTVKKLFTSQIHEIRSMNSSLINIAYELQSYLQGGDKYPHTLAKNIEALSSIMSSRIQLADLSSDTRHFKQKKNSSVPVWKHFEKIIKCYTLLVKQKNNDGGIDLNGSCHCTISGVEQFEMIPLILIDNAFKYLPQNSPKDKKIVVSINDNDEIVVCTVTSWGPKIEKDEFTKIFNREYRGKNVVNKVEGSGIGLNFLQDLVLQMNGTVSVNQDSQVWKHQRNEYYETSFKLEFKKN